MHRIILLLICLLTWQCTPPPEVTEPVESRPPIIVGYVFGSTPIEPGSIDARHLTHINYAFADVVDNQVRGYLKHDGHNYRELQKLKKVNPDLKILISVGGWGKSNGFSDAALTQSARDSFVESALDYLQHYQIDGIDIDWEYPAQPGAGNIHRPEDKQNFTLLLRDLRAGLDSLGRRDQRHYLLTIASAANQRYLELTELDKAHQYLDFINIMTYDFAGSWMDSTAHHANLYPAQQGISRKISAANSVAWHREAGVPAEKLVLGVPFFGREWQGVEPRENGLHQYGIGGDGVPFHQILAYLDTGRYQRIWDETALAPYLWNPDKKAFVTYEDPESLGHKAGFIKKEGLAGAMFWKYRGDTTQTLVRHLYEQLNQE